MCKRRKRGRKKKKCFIPCCSSVEESDGEDSYGADPRPTKIGSVLVSSDSPSICDRVVLLMNRTFKRGNRNIITVREQTDPSRRIVFTPPPRDFALPGQCFQEVKEAPQRIVETPKPRPVLITPKRTLVSHQVECFDEEPEEPQKTGNVQKEEEEEEIPNIAHVKSIAKARRKKKKTMEENKEMDSYDTGKKENQDRAFPHKSEPLVLEDLDNIDKEESIPEHKELMETKPTPVDEEDMGPPLSSSTTFIGGDDKEEEDFGPLLSSSTTFISPSDGNKGFICNENPAVNKKVVKQNAVIAVQPTESANSFRLSDGDDKRSKARKEDKKSKSPQPPRIIKVKPVNKGKSDFKEAEQDKKPEEKENGPVSPTRPVTPMRFRMRRPSWSGWG